MSLIVKIHGSRDVRDLGSARVFSCKLHHGEKLCSNRYAADSMRRTASDDKSRMPIIEYLLLRRELRGLNCYPPKKRISSTSESEIYESTTDLFCLIVSYRLQIHYERKRDKNTTFVYTNNILHFVILKFFIVKCIILL